MKQFIICPECRSFELAQIESRVPARWDFYRCTKCRQLIPGDERLLAKAISIKQPWSFLIASGIKDVENRTWQTKFRGRVLLHAGAKRQTGILDSENSTMTDKQWEAIGERGRVECVISDSPTSAIIGSVEIVNCMSVKINGAGSKSIWAELGYFHWILRNPILFEKPILNVKGALSFFTPLLPL